MSAKRSLHHVPGPREQRAEAAADTLTEPWPSRGGVTSWRCRETAGTRSGVRRGMETSPVKYLPEKSTLIWKPFDGLSLCPSHSDGGSQELEAPRPGALWWAVPLPLRIQRQTFSESGMGSLFYRQCRRRDLESEQARARKSVGAPGSPLSGATLGREAATFFSCQQSKLRVQLFKGYFWFLIKHSEISAELLEESYSSSVPITGHESWDPWKAGCSHRPWLGRGEIYLEKLAFKIIKIFLNLIINMSFELDIQIIVLYCEEHLLKNEINGCRNILWKHNH